MKKQQGQEFHCNTENNIAYILLKDPWHNRVSSATYVASAAHQNTCTNTETLYIF